MPSRDDDIIRADDVMMDDDVMSDDEANYSASSLLLILALVLLCRLLNTDLKRLKK